MGQFLPLLPTVQLKNVLGQLAVKTKVRQSPTRRIVNTGRLSSFKWMWRNEISQRANWKSDKEQIRIKDLQPRTTFTCTFHHIKHSDALVKLYIGCPSSEIFYFIVTKLSLTLPSFSITMVRLQTSQKSTSRAPQYVVVNKARTETASYTWLLWE